MPPSAKGQPSPHCDPTAEARVLGLCLSDAAKESDATARCLAAGVTFEWFSDSQHETIWRGITALHARQSPVDESLVHAELNSHSPGLMALYQLAEPFLTTSGLQLPEWLNILREHHERRSLIKTARLALEQAQAGVELEDIRSSLVTRLGQNGVVRTSGDSKAIKTPEQLLAKVTDETHYRLGSGMLGKGHINCVLGVGGVGKSRWVFNLAHAHAAGRPNFFGWDLRGQGGKWCIVGNENDDDRIKTDLQGLSGVYSKDERAKAYPLIRWINPDDDDESEGGCIDNKAGRAWLIARLIEEQPEFIVFDTLQSVCEALDLNADADMSEACRWIKFICRKVSATCTAIVVHHARAGTQNLKDALNPFTAGNYGRNSKVLYNKSRADVLLFPGDSEDAAKLVVAQGKLNNGKRFTPFGIVFNGHTYEWDREFDLDAYKNDLDGKQSGTKFSLRQLLECLELGKLSRSDLIAKAKTIVDVEPTTVKNRLESAKKLGLVETVIFGIYSLTEEGRRYLAK